jgi:hypothetical protein
LLGSVYVGMGMAIHILTALYECSKKSINKLYSKRLA